MTTEEKVSFGTKNIYGGEGHFTNLPPVGGYWPVISRSGHWYGSPSSAVTTLVMLQSTLYYSPITINGTPTISAVGLEITAGAGSSSVRLAIYSDVGDNTGPGNLLLEFGTIDSTSSSGSAGTLTQITGLSQLLAQGRYWLAAVAQGGAPTCRSFSTPLYALGSNFSTPGAIVASGYSQGSITSTLPNPAAPAFTGVGGIPRVMIKFA